MGQDVAAFVAGDRLVGVFEFEVGVSRGLWCATRRCLSEWRWESFIAGPS